MRAFASSLDSVPLALAENSGLPPIETLAEVKSRQVTSGDHNLGIDCLGKGDNGAFRFKTLFFFFYIYFFRCDVHYSSVI